MLFRRRTDCSDWPLPGCHDYPVLASFQSCPVPVALSQLSSPCCRELAILSSLFCQVNLSQLSCPGKIVLAVLSRLACHSCSVPVVLSRLFCPGWPISPTCLKCPVPEKLFRPSWSLCPGRVDLAGQSVLAVVPCPEFLVLAVRSQPTYTGYPALAVLSWAVITRPSRINW